MAKKEQELTASMIDTFREFKETKNMKIKEKRIERYRYITD